MRNIKIWQKLGVLALVGATPVIVLLVMLVASRNEQITRTERERTGLAYLHPLRDLLEHVPQHRAAFNSYLNGDSAAQAQVARLQPLIDRDIEALEALDRGVMRGYGLSAAWDSVRANWRDLRDKAAQMSARESFTRHTQLINGTLQLIRLAGDRTGLTTDPEIGSFYLADNLLVQLGETAEAMDQLRAYGAGLASRGKPAAEETAQMIYLTRLISANNGKVERNTRAALENTRGLREKLDAPMGEAVKRAGLFANDARIQVAQGSGAIPAENYWNDGTAAIQAYFRLWDASAETMGGILEARAAQLNSQMWSQVAMALLVLLLASGLTLVLQRDITTQVRSIMDLFAAIGKGDYQARADVHSGDELGMIAGGLNRMLDNTLSLMQSNEEKQQIQQSIAHLLDEVSGVADGDLTKEAEVTADITGAIADSFNYMISQLRGIISSVQQTTHAVNSSASQVQDTAEVLARGSAAQTEQILQASTAIEQMVGSIQQVSRTAASAEVVAREAMGSARLGAESVRKTIDGMNSIRGQVQETSKRIKRLGESSQEIGEIVELIGDIADRTSILALNASIQAAMAGEAGKGFAVVADEVERLAERATEATKRIGALIRSVQGDMTEAISAMEQTTREVVGGSQLANEAGQKLTQIEQVSRQISELVQQISQAAQQQAAGSDSVSRNVVGISDVTRQNAEGARQTAASIRQLATLAEQLNQSVSRFRVPSAA